MSDEHEPLRQWARKALGDRGDHSQAYVSIGGTAIVDLCASCSSSQPLSHEGQTPRDPRPSCPLHNLWCLPKIAVPLAVAVTRKMLPERCDSMAEQDPLFTPDAIRAYLNHTGSFARPNVLEAQLMTKKQRHVAAMQAAQRHDIGVPQFGEFVPYYLLGLWLEAIHAMPTSAVLNEIVARPLHIEDETWYGPIGRITDPPRAIEGYEFEGFGNRSFDRIREIVRDDRWALGAYASARAVGVMMETLLDDTPAPTFGRIAKSLESITDDPGTSTPFFDDGLQRTISVRGGFFTRMDGIPGLGESFADERPLGALGFRSGSVAITLRSRDLVVVLATPYLRSSDVRQRAWLAETVGGLLNLLGVTGGRPEPTEQG